MKKNRFNRATQLFFVVMLLLSLIPLSFYSVGATLTYYDAGWTFRKTITIDNTMVEVNMPDFPVLIKNTSVDYRYYAQSDGDDFVFTTTAGVKLSHEIEKYNPLTGELIAWVKIPLLSSTVDTTIYLYYGNTTATNQQNPTGVWDTRYQGVWHMNDATTSTILDSTVNNSDGNKKGANEPILYTSGQIGYCQDFDGVDDYIATVSDIFNYTTGDFSVEYWFYSDDHPGAAEGLVSKGEYDDLTNGLLTNLWGDTVYGYLASGVNAPTVAYDHGIWKSILFVRSGDTLSVYENKTVHDTHAGHAGESLTNTYLLTLGNDRNYDIPFDGKLDEVRVSNTARNWSYHNASYNNQYAPSSYITVSSYGLYKYAEFHPTANGAVQNLNLVSGGFTHWSAVLTDDMNVVGESNNVGYVYDTYVFSDHTTQTGIINNITLHGKFYRSLANTPGKMVVYIGGSPYYGAAFTITNTAPPCVYYNTTWTTNPATTNPWTWAEIDSTQYGIALNPGNPNILGCDYLFLTVNYSGSIPSTAPTGLTATMGNATRINLSWTSNSWGNTVVTRKLGSMPTLPNDGTIVYNGSASTYSDTGVIPSHNYSYKAWCFNTSSSIYGIGNTSDYNWTRPERIAGSTVNVVKVGVTYYINISWLNASGVYHTRTVIRHSLVSQPVLPTDGTEAYNGTGKPYFNETYDSSYYTLFHYNGTVPVPFIRYSIGSYASSYYFLFNCYNESSGLAITNWNILVSNSSGSQIYSATNCNNSLVVPVGIMPSGLGCTITFSRANYTTRTYTQTIVKDAVYTISGYLAHFILPDVPPVNTSYLYLLSVVNDYGSPTPGALITVKRVIGGSYISVTSGITDGNGQFSCYLVPGANYKFFITKEGYANETADWTPSDSLFTHTFMIYSEPSPDTVFTNITLSIEPTETNFDTGFTVYYNITSSDSKLVWFNATVSWYNSTTATWLLLYSHNTTSTTGGTISYAIANVTGNYRFRCGYEKTGFTEYSISVYYSIVWSPVVNDTLNFTLTKIVGRSPIYVPTISGETVASYGALVAAFISIFVLFGFSPKFSGLAIMATGGILGFCKSPLGLITNDVLTYVACGFIIVLGVLVTMAANKDD